LPVVAGASAGCAREAAEAVFGLLGLAELEAQPMIKIIDIKKKHVRRDAGGVRMLTTFILLIFSRQGKRHNSAQARSRNIHQGPKDASTFCLNNLGQISANANNT
jgi:hypothetical protein